MNRFVGMTEEQKVRRLCLMAEAGLWEYDLAECRVSFLGQSFNAIFRVEDRTGEPYVLRIHRLNTYGAAELRSEFVWLQAIRRDTDLLVCEPVVNRHEDAVTELAVHDVPGPHYCTLLRWNPGRPLDDHAPTYHYAMMGELMAGLHNHSSRFVPLPGFVRPRRGLGHAPECVRMISPLTSSGLIPTGALGVLQRVADRIDRTLAGLGEHPDVFGLIHADMHGGNVLFHEGTVRAIDFDGCAWGHYMYDLATAIYHLRPRCIPAFLEGYQQVRCWPGSDLENLDTFVALRMLDQLAYHLSAATPDGQTLLHRTVDLLENQYLLGRPFLGDAESPASKHDEMLLLQPCSVA